MRMSSSMRWRSGDTAADGVGVQTSMILLLSVTEADCLDRQHRRITGATKRHQRSRSVYRASGLVRRCTPVTQFLMQAPDQIRRKRERLVRGCRGKFFWMVASTGSAIACPPVPRSNGLRIGPQAKPQGSRIVLGPRIEQQVRGTLLTGVLLVVPG